MTGARRQLFQVFLTAVVLVAWMGVSVGQDHSRTENKSEFRPRPMCLKGSSRNPINLRRLDGEQLVLSASINAQDVESLQSTGRSEEFRYDAGQGSRGTPIQIDPASNRKRKWHQVQYQGQSYWVIDDVAEPCRSDQSSSGSSASAGFMPLPVMASEAALESRPAIAKQWLDGNPRSSGFTVSQPTFMILKDRCKAGFMFFGDQFCMVHARGSPTADPPLAQGVNSFGESCKYPKQDVENGSTPIDPPPTADLQMGATGSDPNDRLGAAQRVKMFGAWPEGRDSLVIHAGRQKEHIRGGQRHGLDFNIEAFNTHGCIRTRESCQKAFARWVSENDGPQARTLQLRQYEDDSSMMDGMKRLKRSGRAE